jgi:hypothetical protein
MGGRLRRGLIGVGVACGAMLAMAGAGASAAGGCALPRAAVALARSGGGVLYSRGGALYGCDGGRTTKLGILENSRALGGTHIALHVLDGRYAGIDLRANGIDTLGSTVRVVDLASGRTVASASATSPENRAESFISVASQLVIDAHGTLAWIGSRSAVGAFRPVFEVRTLGSGGERLLDSGPRIRPKTLALHGRVLTWSDDGRGREATLSP